MTEMPWSNPKHSILKDIQDAWEAAQTRLRTLVRPESADELRATIERLGLAGQIEIQASEFVPEGQAILMRLCRHGRPHAICFECSPVGFDFPAWKYGRLPAIRPHEGGSE